MATQANLRFTSKDEVRTVRDILQNKVVEKIQEQSEILKKVQLKVLSKKLSSMSKHILSKAATNIPIVSSAGDAEPEDEELKIQVEEAAKACAEFKVAYEQARAETLRVIQESVQKQLQEVEGTLLVEEDEQVSDDDSKWPTDIEFARLGAQKQKIDSLVAKFENELPKEMDSVGNLAEYIGSEARPRSKVELAVAKAANDMKVQKSSRGGNGRSQASSRGGAGKAASSRINNRINRKNATRPY